MCERAGPGAPRRSRRGRPRPVGGRVDAGRRRHRRAEPPGPGWRNRLAENPTHRAVRRRHHALRRHGLEGRQPADATGDPLDPPAVVPAGDLRRQPDAVHADRRDRPVDRHDRQPRRLRRRDAERPRGVDRILLAVTVGLVVGSINGLAIGVMKVNPLIMTLGMASVLLGVITVGIRGWLSGSTTMVSIVRQIGSQPLTDFLPKNIIVWADAVHITIPNDAQAGMALQAIAAGKHVICEKPLAMDAAEGIELLRAANAAGIVHAVNFNLRFYAQCHQAKSLVESGELGKVLLMHGQYLQDWLLNETDWNWRLEPGLGGDMRVVADIGSHWLDLMTFIGGKRLKEVCADFATLMETRKKPTKPVETFAGKTLDPADMRGDSDHGPKTTPAILLRYEDGVHGVCTVSQMSAGRKNHLAFEVDCAHVGFALAPRIRKSYGSVVAIGQASRCARPALLSPSGRAARLLPGGHAEGFPDTFKQLTTRRFMLPSMQAPRRKNRTIRPLPMGSTPASRRGAPEERA